MCIEPTSYRVQRKGQLCAYVARRGAHTTEASEPYILITKEKHNLQSGIKKYTTFTEQILSIAVVVDVSFVKQLNMKK